MSDTNDTPQENGEVLPASTPASVTSSSPAPQPPGHDQRRRLRELLSVPESQRSDAVWDEIIELEIQLAPGNRIGGAPVAKQNDRSGGSRGAGGGGGGPGGGPGGAGGGGGGGNWKRNAGRKHPKPGPRKPPGGGAPPAA